MAQRSEGARTLTAREVRLESTRRSAEVDVPSRSRGESVLAFAVHWEVTAAIN